MRVVRGLSVLVLLALSSFAAQAETSFTTLRAGGTSQVFALKLTGCQPAAGHYTPGLTAERVALEGAAFLAQHGAELGISPAPEDLVALPAEVDKLGLGHQRFLLRYKGVPVVGGEVVLHVSPATGVYYATAKPMGIPPWSTVPNVPEDKALSLAIAAWQQDLRTALVPTVEEPKLVVLALSMIDNTLDGKTSLAWEIGLRSADDELLSDELYYVDAQNGGIEKRLSRIRFLYRKVLDCAKYPGTPSCYLDSYGGHFPQGDYWFGRSENAPVRGPYPRSEYPFYYGSLDVDILHSLLGAAHGYWLDTFGLNGANGQGGLGLGGSIPVGETWGYTHADNTSTKCPDFCWYSETVGAVVFCRKMATPDVVGHEYSHGVVWSMFTDAQGHGVGTTYEGETGALEESFADMAGEAVEGVVMGSHDWHFGTWQDTPPGSYPSCSHGTFRDLAEPWTLLDDTYDPPTVYPERFHSPSVYCGTDDFGGIHHNSTVPSYAMYMLSVGGDFNGCHIDSIGFDAAQQVLYRAWKFYFTRTATFNEAYFALQQASADLYPESVTTEVRKALQAVEMDQPGLCSGVSEQPPPCMPPNGVCCAPDGSCTLTTEAACGAPNGWQGGATTCTPNPCPLPSGACCGPDGSCTAMLQSQCSGEWTMFGTCEPNPCTQPTGACCAPDGACTVTVQAECPEPNSWQGADVPCAPELCTPSGVDDAAALATTLSVRAVPSPFAGRTDLVFAGPKATEAKLVIVDASGRMVRSAWQGILSGRVIKMGWDGRDDSGRDVPAGVYLARLRSGSGSVVTRLVKAR
jgi:Zn-dependent metalloprotease